jgi:hypothetical protein
VDDQCCFYTSIYFGFRTCDLQKSKFAKYVHLKNFGFETYKNVEEHACKTLGILPKYITIGTQLLEIYHVLYQHVENQTTYDVNSYY